MREVLIRIQCDGCTETLTEDTVVEVSLQAGTASYEADLCGDCVAGSVVHMREVMPKKKVTRKSRAKPGRYACEMCSSSFTTSSGLTRHQTVTHGKIQHKEEE